MAKTYGMVVYDDDGQGVTSSVTEYGRGADGRLSYTRRSWLDADETAVVLQVLDDAGQRAEVAALERMVRASDALMAPTA